jgi:hypothetical protein
VGAQVAPSLDMLIDAPFNEITNAILGAAIEVHRVHRAQVLTYMKLTNCPPVC